MIWIIFCLIPVQVVFPLDCSKLQFWNIETRRKEICKNDTKSLYHCAWDLFSKSYEEICWPRVNLIRKGERPTIQLGLHIGNCSSERYQPSAVLSKDTVDCWYLKSMCSEEGQIVYNDTSPYQDTSCRCDYTKGYAFVETPRNKCHCYPSEEDCSCFLKICENSTHVLGPEYQCVEQDFNMSLSQCPVIRTAVVKPRQSKTKIKIDTSNITDSFKSGQRAAMAILILLLLYVLLCGFLLLASPLKLKATRESQEVNEGEQISLSVDVQGIALIKLIEWQYCITSSTRYLSLDGDVEINNKNYFARLVTLQIDDVTQDHNGIFECVICNYVGNKYSAKQMLRVIPKPVPSTEEKRNEIQTKKENIRRRVDNKLRKLENEALYVTSLMKKCDDILNANNILILRGHKHSGKSTACKHICKLFKEKSFDVLWFSTNDDLKDIAQYSSQGTAELFIFDINMNASTDFQSDKDLIDTITEFPDHTKIILTSEMKFKNECCGHFHKDQQVNLNLLSDEDRRGILDKHILLNNIKTCETYAETNYENLDLIRDTSVQVILYEKVVADIVKSECIMGYPFYCKEFCSNRELLFLEDRFFKNPPKSTIESINRLRSSSDSIRQYVVLVYIMMQESLDPRNIVMETVGEICTKLGETCIQSHSVSDAATVLKDKYLVEQNGKYVFDENIVQKATWVSYVDIDPLYCVTNCRWEYIVDLVRPLSWPVRDNDVYISVEYHHILHRLKEEMIGYGTARSVGSYLRKLSTHGEHLTDEFCRYYVTQQYNTDIALNFFNGLSDAGNDVEIFKSKSVDRPFPANLIYSPRIDEFNNSIMHYCVLQNFKNIHTLAAECSDKTNFLNEENKKGFSPCDIAFYLLRYDIIKDLNIVPKNYEHYKQLNRLSQQGKGKCDSAVESKDLNVVGQMNLQSSVVQKSKFGSKKDFKNIKQTLRMIRDRVVYILRIKNIPLEVEDLDIENELKERGCKVIEELTRERKRDKETKKLTMERTGDRIAVCGPLNEDVMRSVTSLTIGQYTGHVSKI